MLWNSIDLLPNFITGVSILSQFLYKLCCSLYTTENIPSQMYNNAMRMDNDVNNWKSVNILPELLIAIDSKNSLIQSCIHNIHNIRFLEYIAYIFINKLSCMLLLYQLKI